jgi:hypothetical protein
MAQNLSKTTTDHETIRRWAEERGGSPAEVESTAREGQTGIIRIDLPGSSGEATLRRIDWDTWFRKLDEAGLAFVYEEETAGGQRSNFNELVARETAAARAGGARTSRRSGAGGSRSRTSGGARARSAAGGAASRSRTRGGRAAGARAGSKARKGAQRGARAGKRAGTRAAARSSGSRRATRPAAARSAGKRSAGKRGGGRASTSRRSTRRSR